MGQWFVTRAESVARGDTQFGPLPSPAAADRVRQSIEAVEGSGALQVVRDDGHRFAYDRDLTRPAAEVNVTPLAGDSPDVGKLTGGDQPLDVQTAVREFHAAFGLADRLGQDRTVSASERKLRRALLVEEVMEYLEAEQDDDLVGMADGLADVVYVAFGTALTYGIDLAAVLAEVHRSNMSKLGQDGRPVLRDDGKVMKGPGYSAPDLRPLLG